MNFWQNKNNDMREIKFRRPHFYFSSDKFSHFSYWGPIKGGFQSPGTSSNSYTKEGLDQQFTGLQDKFKVDIYEGDINQDKGLVIWNQDNASFMWDYKDVETMEFGEENDWCEIIGNIYETP